jgi:hypothetical protein
MTFVPERRRRRRERSRPTHDRSTNQAQGLNKMVHLRLSAWLAVALAAASGGILRAQDGTVADTEAFARRLAVHKYGDLAMEVIEKALAEPGHSSGDKDSLQFTQAEVQLEIAKRESDQAKRLTAYRECAEKFLKYLKDHPDSPRVNEVRVQVVDVYRLVAEQLTNAARDEKDKTKSAEMRSEAQKAFGTALSIIEPRVADLKSIDTPTGADKRELLALRFALCQVSYLYASTFEDRKSDLAMRRIDQAKSELEEFVIDYSGDDDGALLAFEATRLQAQIAIEEERLDDAAELLNESCAQLADALSNDPAIANNEIVRDVIATAFKERAKFLLEHKNQPEEAIKTIMDCERLMPNLVESGDGRQALMMIAKAQMNEGQNERAKEIAQKILKFDEVSAVATDARDLLERAGVGVEGGSGVLKALQNAVLSKDIGRSEKVASRILERTHNKDRVDEVSEALYTLGSLYFETGRLYDAVACLVSISEDFPQSARAPGAKLGEGQCYAKLGLIERSSQSAWKERMRRAFEELQTRWPNSEEAKEQAFNNGTMLEQESKLVEAIESYKKVSSTSGKYPEAQRRIGTHAINVGLEASARDKDAEAKTYFALAQQALDTSRRLYTKLAGETLNDQEKQRSKDLSFDSGIKLAAILLQPQANDPKKCLTLLDELEAESGNQKDNVSKIWNLRIKAFSQLGQGSEAAKVFDEYLEKMKDKSGGALAAAALAIGSALDREALALSQKTKKDNPEVAALWRKALRFYRLSVEEMKSGGDRSDAAQVGGRLLVLGAILSGVPDSLPLYAIEPGAKYAERESLQRALEAYQMVPSGSGQGVNISLNHNLARASALNGKWAEAVDALDKIAIEYPLFTKEGKLDEAVIAKAKNEDLSGVFQDLAMASIRLGQMNQGQGAIDFNRGIEITNQLMNVSARNGRMYWECRYINLLGYYLRGEYDTLKAALDSLERNSPDYDNKNEFGIGKRIQDLKREVDSKTLSR